MTSAGERPPPTQPRAGHGALWWIFVILSSTVLFVGLLAAATFVVFMENWSSSSANVEKKELEWERTKAVTAQQKLRAAGQDGRLADAEITASVDRKWAIDRLPQELRITTGYRATEWPEPRCWVIVLTLPLGPATRADHAPSALCSSTAIHPPATSSL